MLSHQFSWAFFGGQGPKSHSNSLFDLQEVSSVLNISLQRIPQFWMWATLLFINSWYWLFGGQRPENFLMVVYPPRRVLGTKCHLQIVSQFLWWTTLLFVIFLYGPFWWLKAPKHLKEVILTHNIISQWPSARTRKRGT